MKQRTNYHVSESAIAIFVTCEPESEAKVSTYYHTHLVTPSLQDALALAQLLSVFNLKPVWSAYHAQSA